MKPLRSPVLWVVIVLALAALGSGCGLVRRSAMPSRLSDEEFWRLSSELSEPAGEFIHSDNLVSNELYYVHTIKRLRTRGGVYIGVGPEQNFSYIARLRPEMAFIVDIRRENRNLHLMYKALFELSADRAEFISRLFSRERPDGLSASASVAEMFEAYSPIRPSAQVYDNTVARIREGLGHSRGQLTGEDLDWIADALRAFYGDGPEIRYGRTEPRDALRPSYRVLMTATDTGGIARSYLATAEGFAFVKDLHARNAIIPVVGDFAGSHALRSIGDYVRQHGETVEAYYGSNVEVYLNRQKAAAFCANLAALPYASAAPFIDNKGMQFLSAKLRSCVQPPRGPGL
jgi:hypothetical protein